MIIKRNQGLPKYLNESLAQDMGPTEYKEALEKKFTSGSPVQVGTLIEGTIYHNPTEEDHTSNREAYGKIPWIEYWRRLTGFTGNHLKCSFCGADIFIDVDADDALLMRMEHPKTKKEAYQAVGGHYYKNGKDNSDGFVIIPICGDCNARNENYDLEVTVINEYVEEVGATIKEDED